ncbi:MAG: phosphatidate cytidylyltransferase, partial [Lachnospiraceae bacterium]|nr:phosphatidate cytidylyltransferase [Lachnospiraceae bacterium]
LHYNLTPDEIKVMLLEELSPKKSIEGSIGGIVGSSLAGGLFGWLYAACTDSTYGIIAVFAIICCVGSVVSQCGDLTASAIKRNYDVKDYGKIIPGHGGILDRFDSVIFTSPMVFFLVMLMMQFN